MKKKTTDELITSYDAFRARVDKISYIDKKMLDKHLSFQDSLMTQLVVRMTTAAAKTDKDGKLCSKLTSDLETKYSKQ